MLRLLTFILFSHLCGILNAGDIWENPVIIGASVADGYHNSEPIGGPKSEALSLENYLTRLIKARHGKITNLGNKFYFLRPEPVSRKQIENALKLKPTVILTPDYLFWLIYGNYRDEHQRITLLQRGLRMLEKFDCPVVIGNIPNASAAVHKMLAYSQIPKPETIDKANTIIKKWAQKHDNICVIDLAQFMRASNTNTAIKLKHLDYPNGDTKDFLQSDNLHATAKGVVAICYSLLEALQQLTHFPDSDVHWDMKKTAAQ